MPSEVLRIRRSQINRLDALIALAERVRLPARGQPRQRIFIHGGLDNCQRVAHDVGTASASMVGCRCSRGLTRAPSS
jgi:hypothetical protein